MIKCGEAAVQMVLKSGLCNSEKEAIGEIKNIIAMGLDRILTDIQVAEIIEKNSFKEDEMEAICNYTGYVLAYIPKSMLQDIPIA